MNGQILLNNGILRCTVLPYGAILQSLLVPDRNGTPIDVVLGCDSEEDYALSPDYMGAIVGRYANRIAGASFLLNGVQWSLSDNCGGNHIHGGSCGFNAKTWQVVQQSPASVTLSLISNDGEEGYPGRMEVSVTYRLEGASLHITYDAFSDRDTVCNLTNHSYFNLVGQGSGSVLDQQLMLWADHYLPSGSDGVPRGVLERVDGGCMDFRTMHAIGLRIDEANEQLVQSGGYDHCFAINGMPGKLRQAARCLSRKSGIEMEIFTDLPGIQLYTANGLGPARPGKNGASYGSREAFCLETQFFPDSPNHPEFPSPVLRAGDRFHSETVYRFRVNTEKNNA